MKPLILIIFLCAFTHAHAQHPFINSKWRTSIITGIKNFKFDSIPGEITFTKPDGNERVGCMTEFLKDNRFISYNYSWCGNECITQVSETYEASGANITLFIISINYLMECKAQPPQIINTTLGTFSWEQKDNQVILTPLKT